MSFDYHLLASSTATALLAATPVLIAATGELFAERVGVYNIGIEGSMLIGAFAAIWAASHTHSAAAALLAALIAGALSSACFGVLVTYLNADLVLTGLALVFVAQGATSLLGSDYVRAPAKASIPEIHLPIVRSTPYLKDAIGSVSALTVVAFILPFAAAYILNHTRHGLAMRAIGESPAAADVAGVSVRRWRVFYVAVGGALAGLGGAFLALVTVSTWLNNLTAGQGWIALAIVIFASWRPLPLIVGALVFGGLGTLGDVAQVEGWGISSTFLSSLPYVGTLALVCLLAWLRTRKTGWPPWPAALGVPFIRGAEQ